MGDAGKFALLHALSGEAPVRMVALSSGREEGQDMGFDVDVTNTSLRADVKLRLEAVRQDILHVDVDDPDAARIALERVLADDVGAVVACLGNRQPSMARWCGPATEALVGAMTATGVSRLVLLSSFGLPGEKIRGFFAIRLLWKTMLRTILRGVRRDLVRLEAAVTSSDIDYLLVRPVGLTPESPPKGTWTIIRSANEKPLAGISISKSDVGAFMLQEAQNPTLHRETVVIGPSPDSS
ncbi:hypothetical protein CTAYLR_010624 [Chrysophaeum taylorii]|uniref:NAD(P)-binding domain-containing protein n=1 Tax=Chrysophaeum taylorii TaxID=2483200 RepID=A0AAD7UF09_9STRA|nr:hypothetical protein CTAYLR_010624 [Chrysophaeum taylorii]